MSSLPTTIQQVFIEAFAKIPQRVLWKYDGEIKGLPDNIMTKDWFPQRDILRKSSHFFKIMFTYFKYLIIFSSS